MLEQVDLGKKLDKAASARKLKALQSRLRLLQYAVQEANIPVIVCVEGWNACGRGGVINTLLGSLVMGIIATVQSAKVSSRWDLGDAAGALRASRTAKGLNIAVSILAALEILLFIIVAVTAHGGSTTG